MFLSYVTPSLSSKEVGTGVQTHCYLLKFFIQVDFKAMSLGRFDKLIATLTMILSNALGLLPFL